MKVKKADTYAEAYSPIKGLVDPKWDGKRTPDVGQVWVVRTPDGSDLPLLCIVLEKTEEEKIEYVMKPDEFTVVGTTHPKITVASVKITTEEDSAMFIKKTSKGTFFDKKRLKLIKQISTNDFYAIKETKAVVKFFCLTSFSTAYLAGNIAAQHAYPLNPELSKKWIAEYIKFKMLVGIKGFDKPENKSKVKKVMGVGGYIL